ncbi:acetyltransferase [Curvibacter sp. APW13]|uniref:acetyltransferase n=1 Tax=Curvibacter sp. APW13 TaxID=3077236 RepID=UPI0028E03028|nr:acetyltransferase [Curvibacter sp. APW13]MDT8993018.1 acetyltransferase [Curvibacter sp. APW13]
MPHADVLGFVVADEVFVPGSMLCGRPVYPLSEIQERVPPLTCGVLVAASYREMNGMRVRRSEDLWALGYRPASFVSPRAWVAQDTVIESNTLILDGVSIHSGTRVGQGSFISSGAVIGHDCIIGDYNWIGSAAVFAGCVQSGARCFFGLRATVTQHVQLGQRVYVGATALVTKNLPDGAVQVHSQSAKPIDMDSMRYCALVTP